mmetsp:Transcript_24390/g.51957  ORF Transcript_24390/g.51957 Transcript_24390/m.51957 type:complete len:184 (+) Transcript_24390:99-650(+)
MGCACGRAANFNETVTTATPRPAGVGAGPSGRNESPLHSGASSSAGHRTEASGAGRPRRGPPGAPRGGGRHRQQQEQGGLGWMVAFDDRYTEALNERMLQEVLEQSKKAHLLTGLPREKFEAAHHHDMVECELCLEDYQEGEELLRLPCVHAFHSKCVLPWLQKSYTCPVCNTDAAQAIEASY